MASKSYEMDMCSGPLPGKILRFAIPLMLSSILQLLFNAADVIVVGQFSGSTSLAAVGSTGALTNLLTNIFLGLSIGANVLVARYYGARQENDVRETIQTSMLIAIVGGLLLVVVGAGGHLPAAGADGDAGGRHRQGRHLHADHLCRLPVHAE